MFDECLGGHLRIVFLVLVDACLFLGFQTFVFSSEFRLFRGQTAI